MTRNMRWGHAVATIIAAAALLSSCSKPDNDGDGPVNPGTDPVVETKVSIAAGVAQTQTLTFTVTSENAASAAWLCIKKGDATPNEADVMQNGTAIEADKTVDCFVNGLTENTSYLIYAAASSKDGKKLVMTEALEMKTLEASTVKAPVPGDFYYSDGTWSTELDKSKTPVAIVFYSGIARDAADAESFYKMKDGQTPLGKVNGYAVALNDANPKNETVWWSFFDGNYPGTASKELTDFLGYSNTQGIISYAMQTYKCFTGEQDSYPAAYCATVGYEKVCPSPKTSSGWFLPSAYQFKYIYDNVYFNKQGTMSVWLEKSFEQLGDAATPLYCDDAEYWTSTEKYDANALSYWAYYFSFDSRQSRPGFIGDYRKSAGFRVRSMLVF